MIQMRPIDKTHFHGRQAAGAWRKKRLPRNGFKHERRTADSQRQPLLKVSGLRLQISRDTGIVHARHYSTSLHLLEGRNLRHIDYVIDLDTIWVGDNLRVMIDAEITHRMGEAESRPGEQYEQDRARGADRASANHWLPLPHTAPSGRRPMPRTRDWRRCRESAGSAH